LAKKEKEQKIEKHFMIGRGKETQSMRGHAYQSIKEWKRRSGAGENRAFEAFGKPVWENLRRACEKTRGNWWSQNGK
jgi:hypothetical protein